MLDKVFTINVFFFLKLKYTRTWLNNEKNHWMAVAQMFCFEKNLEIYHNKNFGSLNKKIKN